MHESDKKIKKISRFNKIRAFIEIVLSLAVKRKETVDLGKLELVIVCLVLKNPILPLTVLFYMHINNIHNSP